MYMREYYIKKLYNHIKNKDKRYQKLSSGHPQFFLYIF